MRIDKDLACNENSEPRNEEREINSEEKHGYSWLAIFLGLILLVWGAAIFVLPDAFSEYDASKWGSFSWLGNFLSDFWNKTVSAILLVVGLLVIIGGIRDGNTRLTVFLSGILLSGFGAAILYYPNALAGYEVNHISKGAGLVRAVLWVWNETVAYIMLGISGLFFLGSILKNDE